MARLNRFACDGLKGHHEGDESVLVGEGGLGHGADGDGFEFGDRVERLVGRVRD